jgi:cytochrome c-type biogenesis protein CcmH/NrfG
LHEVAGGIEARFHLGEIAWQFGNAADAIAAWRSAIEISAVHLPSWHALADAYAASGDFVAALRHRQLRRVHDVRDARGPARRAFA